MSILSQALSTETWGFTYLAINGGTARIKQVMQCWTGEIAVQLVIDPGVVVVELNAAVGRGEDVCIATLVKLERLGRRVVVQVVQEDMDECIQRSNETIKGLGAPATLEYMHRMQTWPGAEDKTGGWFNEPSEVQLELRRALLRLSLSSYKMQQSPIPWSCPPSPPHQRSLSYRI